MSLVDVPPGIPLPGRAAGEFAARAVSVRLARRALGFVALVAVIAFVLRDRGRLRGNELLLTGPIIALSIGAIGYAIRRAHLRVDRDGVRWGWAALGFRVPRHRLVRAIAYRDAIGFVREGGSSWYLARHDFDGYERLPVALRAAGIPFEVDPGRAPLRARLQTYGVALDLLLVLDVGFAGLMLVLALGG